MGNLAYDYDVTEELNISDIKKQSDEIRSVTLVKINQIEQDLAFLVSANESDDTDVDSTTKIYSATDVPTLEKSVRLIKIK